MNEMTYCQNCGAETPAQARFCPHCGAALLLQTVSDDAAELLGQVKARYAAYAAWAEKMLSERSFGRIAMGWLTGNDAFKRSDEHEKFLTDLQKVCGELKTRCESGNVPAVLPELMHFALIDCHADVPQETDWMFLAAEMPFAELLPFLPDAEAAALYPDYRAERKRQPGLQTQKNILKALKQKAQ